MRKEGLAVGGAAVAAIVASLCCVGPVLFAVLSLGAFGAASLFEAARPYLLAVAVLLLAVGFYWSYFRKQEAGTPGLACATKTVNRTGRAGLWIASVVVIAFALTPYYVGHIASGFSQRQPSTATTPATPGVSTALEASQSVPTVETITVKVEGMSCTTCEVPIRDALAHTPGVQETDVSYQRGDARVKFDPAQTDVNKIKRAINSTGYNTK